MRILIVDDDFSTRSILKTLLCDYGDCDVCVNGQEAVQAFRMALDADNPYRLMFMDVLMPVMDGIDALERIREIEKQRGVHPSKEVKIVVLSMVEEAQRVMEAFKKGGVEVYLTKPLDMDKLVQTLKGLGL